MCRTQPSKCAYIKKKINYPRVYSHLALVCGACPQRGRRVLGKNTVWGIRPCIPYVCLTASAVVDMKTCVCAVYATLRTGNTIKRGHSRNTMQRFYYYSCNFTGTCIIVVWLIVGNFYFPRFYIMSRKLLTRRSQPNHQVPFYFLLYISSFSWLN